MTSSLLVLLQPGFITLGGTGGASLAVRIKTQVCSLLCLLKPTCWVQPRHQHCPWTYFPYFQTSIFTHQNCDPHPFLISPFYPQACCRALCKCKWAELVPRARSWESGSFGKSHKEHLRFLLEINVKTKYPYTHLEKGKIFNVLHYSSFVWRWLQYPKSRMQVPSVPWNRIHLGPGVLTLAFTWHTLLLPSLIWIPISLLKEAREILTRSAFTLQNCAV